MIGIYRIYFETNGKSYIGSSTDISKRLDSHYSSLKKGNHTNSEFQSDFTNRGTSLFKYEILCTCDEDELIEKEQIYIDNFNLTYNKRSSEIGSKSRGQVKRELIKIELENDLIVFINRRAKEQNRKPSNYIETILKEHFELKDLQ